MIRLDSIDATLKIINMFEEKRHTLNEVYLTNAAINQIKADATYRLPISTKKTIN